MEEARQQRQQEDGKVIESLVEAATCAEREDLTESTEQAIAHVAGYLARSVGKKHKCHACHSLLVDPRRHRPFRILPRHKGGGGWYDPLAVSPLIELELRGKNERVARRETKRLIYTLKVLGQPVTSEVRPSAEKWRKPEIADNFASDGARAKFQRPACSLRRVEHVTMVFKCPWMIFRGQKFETFSGHMTSLTFEDPVVPWPHFESS